MKTHLEYWHPNCCIKAPVLAARGAARAYLRNRDNDPVVSPGTLFLNGDHTLQVREVFDEEER
jgi:hypothetical protein